MFADTVIGMPQNKDRSTAVRGAWPIDRRPECNKNETVIAGKSAFNEVSVSTSTSTKWLMQIISGLKTESLSRLENFSRRHEYSKTPARCISRSSYSRTIRESAQPKVIRATNDLKVQKDAKFPEAFDKFSFHLEPEVPPGGNTPNEFISPWPKALVLFLGPWKRLRDTVKITFNS
jgi:hypothetical protein